VMRLSRQRSYGIEIRPYGPARERDGIICGHCGCHYWLEPSQSTDELGTVCRYCGLFICQRCDGAGCPKMEEKIDAMKRNGHEYLRRDRLFKLFERSGGKVIK
jgi:hypothetical protein